MKKFLSPTITLKQNDYALLFLRIVFCAFMMKHGYDKLHDFNKMVIDFEDPLHVSPAVSLALTIFAEFFCSLLVLIGLFTRFAAIPVVFCMLVATVAVNGIIQITQHELAPLDLAAFTVFLICGPGRFSVDAILFKTTK